MYVRLAKYFLLIIILLLLPIKGQYNDKDFGLSFSANYTTTARLYLNPNAIERLLREENLEIEDIYSYAFEIRYRVSDSFLVGIGTEYVEKVAKLINVIGFPSQLAGIEINEGFTLIPVELSGYYFIPFSTESLKFYMGGGLGIYFGSYIREFGTLEVETVNQDFAWGIHGRIGMDYMFSDFFSLRGEMKFRDPDFNMENKYTSNSFVYQGNVINLPQEPFATRVNIEGMTFSLAAVVYF
ncbi:MAG: hypothetical protein U5K00_18250 [Melioribacteraceae bacterium]|nr:hypothetical protein [Melioribacteraceae bacterium]